jgi:hypothetical protein
MTLYMFRVQNNAASRLKQLPKIDWEESANAGRVCIRPHIDEELDNRKHVYHGIDSVLVGHIIPESPIFCEINASWFVVCGRRANMRKDAL